MPNVVDPSGLGAALTVTYSASPKTTTTPTPATAPETTTTTIAPRVYDFAEASAVVDAYVTEQGLNGVGLIVVERDDGVVHEEYWGEFDADRISLIASSGKVITASVLMSLDDQGILDVDAPVADVVESLARWAQAQGVELEARKPQLPSIEMGIDF